MTALGVIAGATLTRFIVNQLPANVTGGPIVFLTTGIVAFAQGMVVGSVLGKQELGADMTTGGMTYLALRVLNEFAPDIAGYTPFGLRGMGIYAPSSFYTPQVNQPNSMVNFVVPRAVAGAIPPPAAGSTAAGLGNTRYARRGRVA
jgi:hypothetical protein